MGMREEARPSVMTPSDIKVDAEVTDNGSLRHVLRFREGHIWVDVFTFDDEDEAHSFLERMREWAKLRKHRR